MRLRLIWSIALTLAVALLGADRPFGPCTHVNLDTTGWRAARFSERLSFSLPPEFKRGPEMVCEEGCRVWMDGDRTLFLTSEEVGQNSLGGKYEPRVEGYSECVDTLAGVPFLLITEFRRNKQPNSSTQGTYSAWAVEGGPLGVPRMARVLKTGSPRQSDLNLFLAIFRTLHVDSTTAWEH